LYSPKWPDRKLASLPYPRLVTPLTFPPSCLHGKLAAFKLAELAATIFPNSYNSGLKIFLRIPCHIIPCMLPVPGGPGRRRVCGGLAILPCVALGFPVTRIAIRAGPLDPERGAAWLPTAAAGGHFFVGASRVPVSNFTSKCHQHRAGPKPPSPRTFLHEVRIYTPIEMDGAFYCAQGVLCVSRRLTQIGQTYVLQHQSS